MVIQGNQGECSPFGLVLLVVEKFSTRKRCSLIIAWRHEYLQCSFMINDDRLGSSHLVDYLLKVIALILMKGLNVWT